MFSFLRDLTLHFPLITSLLLFLPFSTGCTSTQEIKPVDTSTVTYKGDVTDRKDLSESTIAILPVLAGEGYEGFRRKTGTELTRQFRKQLPNASVLSSQETRNRISDGEVSSEYSDMMTDYGKTGVLDQDALSRIGSAVEARFLLYSKVGAEGSSESALVAGEYYQETEVNAFDIYAQLWDVEQGDVVWEGTGGAAGLSRATSNNQLLTMAAEGLTERVGLSSEAVPPPATAQDLHDKAQQRASSNYTAAYLLSSLLVIPLYLAL